jgi:hypothetical protein
MSIIQGTTKVSAGGYEIDQSIRFNDDDSAYLTDTLGTATDSNRWTYSVWVKRGALPGTQMGLINSQFAASDTGFLSLQFQTDNTLYMTGWNTVWRRTSQVFRDPSAWYCITVAVDTDQATANDRIKIYVNGEQVTAFSTTNNPSSGANLGLNQAAAHEIGRDTGGIRYFDGYMAEINFVDGQALAPTNFGEYNDDGVWIPKQYEGTYGNNGFYLKGQDSSNLGDDSSGNGNDFASSGLTSDDQRVDTPTNNLMTFNPLNNMRDDGDPTDGNRVFKNTGSTRNLCGTTFHFTTGKYVQAFSASAITSNTWQIGTMPSDEADVNDAPGANEDLDAGVRITPITNYYIGGTGATTDTGITADANDTYWVAMDLDAGKQWVGIYDDSDSTMKWFDSSAGTTGDPAAGSNPTSTVTANDSFNFAVCGRSSVELTLLEESEATAGTIPTGFTYVGAVKGTYAAPAITDGSAYFQTTLYTGTGSTLEVNQSENSTFQPDLVWIKQRNKVDNHVLTDAVRGAPAAIYSNSTAAEVVGTGGVESLDADGFTLGTWNNVNQSGITAAAWQWLAANGTASNTDGDITSTVSANTTAGFSVLTYSGSGTTNDTVGHGLGVKPSVVIVKPRNATDNWIVNDWSGDYANKMKLNEAEASSSAANFVNAASSTTFTLGSDINVNGSGRTFVAYCWNEVEGFSKFGSYVSNGSTDGPFVSCNFRPAFLLIKDTQNAEFWHIYDSTRDTYNVTEKYLYANLTDAEATSSTKVLDFLSNGFKLRGTDGGINSSSGRTYIFMAFAEHPFGGDGVAPVPAR